MKSILRKYIVVEATRKRRYLDFLKDVPIPDKEKLDIVKHAIDSLEREDRIMWYLRKARASDLAEIALKTDEELDQYVPQVGQEIVDKLKAGRQNAINKLSKMINAPLDETKGRDRLKKVEEEGKQLAEVRQDLMHFIRNAKTNSYTSVLTYQFPPNASAKDILDELKKLEQKDLSTRPDERLLTHDGGEDEESIFIELPNKWAWYFIDAETCVREGKAMRHCGNSAPNEGDRILSLRERVTVEKGRKKNKYLKPHATFILDSAGYLGEMKGFANTKPSVDMHPYILKLLEDKRIKGIKGGGYMPGANFSLADLSVAQLTELKRLRPDMKFKSARAEKEIWNGDNVG